MRNGQLFGLPGDGRELKCEAFVPRMELDLNPNKIVDEVVGGVKLFCGAFRLASCDYRQR